MKQHMIQGLAALTRRLDKNAEALADRGLPNIISEFLGADGTVDPGLFAGGRGIHHAAVIKIAHVRDYRMAERRAARMIASLSIPASATFWTIRPASAGL